MEFWFASRAEIIRLQGVSRTHQIFQRIVWFQARECEVWRVRAGFAGEAEGLERFFDRGGEFGEIGSGLHAAPKYARLEFVGEETEDAKIHRDGLRGTNWRQGCADFGKFLRVRFAQKFQSDVHGFRAHPARSAAFGFQALRERRECVAHRVGQVEGDEQAHGFGSGPGGGGKKIVAAHRIERGLRRELANAFAIAGKTISAFAGAVFVGEADVDEAHRFFRRAAAGTSDAGDADAESRASAFADTVGEGERDFGTDRAFRFEQTLRNADEAGFQFVAVADHAAQKIGGAAGNFGEAFGEQAAGAAFGDGDGGAIFGEDARDDFFEGFSVRRIKMFAESQSHAVGDFVEKFFGFGWVAGPGARMQLRAAGRGEDGGFGVGIKLVKRADTRLDIGFAQAGGAQVACEEALSAGNFREARADLSFEDRFEFVRHAGKQHDDMSVGLEPQRRSSAARIWEHGGAFGDHRLALIYFGHGARETAKAFLDFAHDGFAHVHFAAKKFGDGFARAVVISRAQTATGDDQVRAIQSVAEGGAHLVARIADNGFVDHADADFI